MCQSKGEMREKPSFLIRYGGGNGRVGVPWVRSLSFEGGENPVEFLRKGVLCLLPPPPPAPRATPAEPGHQEASYLKREAREPLKLGNIAPVCDITSPDSPSRTGHPGSLDPAPLLAGQWPGVKKFAQDRRVGQMQSYIRSWTLSLFPCCTFLSLSACEYRESI